MRSVLGVDLVSLPPAVRRPVEQGAEENNRENTGANAEVGAESIGESKSKGIGHESSVAQEVETSQAHFEVMFYEPMSVGHSFHQASEAREMLEKMAGAMGLKSFSTTQVALPELFENLRGRFFVVMAGPNDEIWGHRVDDIAGQWLGSGLITFHPEYLIENPEQKRVVWTHLQRVMKELSQ